PFADLRQVLLEAQDAAAPPATENFLHDVLLDSVAHHHVADVPVGIFLSAGRGSAAIAALSKEMEGGELRTFTLGFEDYRGTAKDEVPLAESVAQALGTRQTTRWIAGELFAKSRSDVLEAMDQPSVDGINTYFVSKLTSEA